MHISHLAPGTLFVWGNSMFVRRGFVPKTSKTRIYAKKIAYRCDVNHWVAVVRSQKGLTPYLLNQYIMHRDIDVEPVVQ